jgi:hypothetical protein
MKPSGLVRWWTGIGAVDSLRHIARCRLKARRGVIDSKPTHWNENGDDVYELGIDDGLGVFDAHWNLLVSWCCGPGRNFTTYR